ncbi:MAG: lytic transglycosylase domain-containing protein [Pyrinomonadaceae bacterium]
MPELPIAPPPGFTGLPAVEIPGIQVDFPFDLINGIRSYAAASNLPPSLVWGIVQTESGGDPNAQNPSDPSAGLMQVTPLIGRAFGSLKGSDAVVLASLLDPETNLRAGTRFVAHLQSRYAAKFPLGEWIQAYNVGETKFDRGIRNDLYGDRVLKFAATWRG